MQSFRQYITEDQIIKSKDQMIQMIDMECQPFIQKIISFDNMPFTGRKESGPFIEKRVRKNRTPKNTDEQIQDIVDDWMENNFGIRFRSNSFFATGSYKQASSYGSVFAIFPIGEFSFLWSPRFEDLYLYVGEFQSYFSGISSNEDFEKTKKLVISRLEEAMFKDDDLNEAIKSGNEIMINCDKYYAIEYSIFQKMKENMEKELF